MTPSDQLSEQLPTMCSTSHHLQELQEILDHEIPMCGHMEIAVAGSGPDGLIMKLPLDPNRNHQQTAFAGSLNALCTIAGWGTTFLLMKELQREGTIVIRRSSIRYHQPVVSSEIAARCLPIASKAREYFLEMLAEKGQAKLNLNVEIAGPNTAAVSFDGSYVVIQ